MTSASPPFRIAAANSLRGAARSAVSGGAGAAAGSVAALASALAFSAGTGWATWSGIRAARAVLPQLPALVPEVLVERLLAAGLVSAAFLLVLGTLTTAVSTLFLSPDTEALVPLPVPHARLFGRQLSRTVLSASAPTLLLVLPVLAVAAASSRQPLLAASAGLAFVTAVLLGAGLAGCTLALLLVRLVPPRRARLFAAAVSALGLVAALFGVRGARPERLFDPAAALALLERFGTVAPARSPFDPFAAGAHAMTQALFGDVHGLRAAVLLLAAAAALTAVVAQALAPLHLRLWQETREAAGRGDFSPGSRRPVRSPGAALFRAESASLLREASTPAQVGSLAAVFVLQILNLRLLPAGDASARDVLAGLETGLALFLVAALSLRFGTPAVSSDGRSALLLRTLPLSPRRHLLVRTAVRVVPAAAAALVLVGAAGVLLKPSPAAIASSFAAGLAGAFAIPALHVGLGALSPRYDAPGAVAVALGPAGLLALVLSTALALLSTLVVSGELRALGTALLHVPLDGGALTGLFLGACALAAVLPLVLGGRALARRDLPSS
jgi:ABC-2 type transport system permease protein